MCHVLSYSLLFTAHKLVKLQTQKRHTVADLGIELVFIVCGKLKKIIILSRIPKNTRDFYTG